MKLQSKAGQKKKRAPLHFVLQKRRGFLRRKRLFLLFLEMENAEILPDQLKLCSSEG
jgi:hypothetical protein